MDDSYYDLKSKEIIRQLYSLFTPEPDDARCFGIVFGGQPGAGKSHLDTYIRKQFGANVVDIDLDKYRFYHPDFQEFQKDLTTSTQNTQEFARNITERLIRHFVKSKYNLTVTWNGTNRHIPLRSHARWMQDLKKLPIDLLNRIYAKLRCISWCYLIASLLFQYVYQP